MINISYLDCSSHILMAPIFKIHAAYCIAPSLLQESSNFLFHYVLRENRYAPYQPIQDRCQNALKSVQAGQGQEIAVAYPKT